MTKEELKEKQEALTLNKIEECIKDLEQCDKDILEAHKEDNRISKGQVELNKKTLELFSEDEVDYELLVAVEEGRDRLIKQQKKVCDDHSALTDEKIKLNNLFVLLIGDLMEDK